MPETQEQVSTSLKEVYRITRNTMRYGAMIRGMNYRDVVAEMMLCFSRQGLVNEDGSIRLSGAAINRKASNTLTDMRRSWYKTKTVRHKAGLRMYNTDETMVIHDKSVNEALIKEHMEEVSVRISEIKKLLSPSCRAFLDVYLACGGRYKETAEMVGKSETWCQSKMGYIVGLAKDHFGIRKMSS